MNATNCPPTGRADLLLDYEWRMVLEALRRDMLREQGIADVAGTLQSVHGYNASVIRRVLDVLDRHTHLHRDTAPAGGVHPPMTARERDVARLLFHKMTAKQIGRALGISHRTVDVYRSRLLQKFHVKSTAELLALQIPGASAANGGALGTPPLSREK